MGLIRFKAALQSYYSLLRLIPLSEPYILTVGHLFYRYFILFKKFYYTFLFRLIFFFLIYFLSSMMKNVRTFI